MTVTEKRAYWVIPTGIKQVPYAQTKDIRFEGKKNSHPEASKSRSSHSPTPVQEIAASNEEEMKIFYSSLASCSSKPAILALVEPFSSSYVPKFLDSKLPMSLSQLFKPEYLRMNYGELLKEGEKCTLTVTTEEAKVVEQQTRGQAKSRFWFRMRTGRITASYFKVVCHTDVNSPLLSLIMRICHPELSKFRGSATCWGCEHESTVRGKYESMNLEKHCNFSVSDCGFFINFDYPFIGASPDGLVTCYCCGDGICEIKVCP